MSLCARDRISTGIAPSTPPPLQSNSPRHDVRECPRARLPEPHNRFAPFAPSFRLYLISLKADQWRRAHRSPSGRISISTTTNRIGRCAATVGRRETAEWDNRMGTSEWDNVPRSGTLLLEHTRRSGTPHGPPLPDPRADQTRARPGRTRAMRKHRARSGRKRKERKQRHANPDPRLKR